MKAEAAVFARKIQLKRYFGSRYLQKRYMQPCVFIQPFMYSS